MKKISRGNDSNTTIQNRLAGESSPYLRQHANNPVDWYPWAEEAIARARKENKPIFLSIGYSACHWCHVMERESFENAEVADILNRNFISIKVDREELPDVDEVYMDAVQVMTGSGGWPLSLFLTPELKPFYGGTYFPPEDRFGLPGLKSLLLQIIQLWETERFRVLQGASQVTEAIQENFARTAPAGQIGQGVLESAVQKLKMNFDSRWGGFGGAPKFPPANALSFLLRSYDRTGDEETLQMVELTLDRMAEGGMYDQLGGGFHRYSTDSKWLIPHFEKMLYDNALLGRAYLEGWLITGNDTYRRIVEETLDYVLRDMTNAQGGFYSAEDADSEGEEGKYYVWTPAEIKYVLGEEDGALLCDYYGVTESGNFEGASILYRPHTDQSVASQFKMSTETLQEKLRDMRRRLLAARERRIHPAKDDKIISGWNGMMISTLARAGQALHEERFLAAAEKGADFILNNMREAGRLRHMHAKGQSKGAGYLDDYAHLINALIDLYESRFDSERLEVADQMCAWMIAEFWDDRNGGFFFTGAEHTNLPARTKPYFDSAVPSGNAVAALALVRLRHFMDKPDYEEKALTILNNNTSMIDRAPRAFLNLLEAAEYLLYPVSEIVIAGPRNNPATEKLLNAVQEKFISNRVLAFVDPSTAEAASLQKRIPLVKGKGLVSGSPAAYVCRNYTCKEPVTDPVALIAQIKKGE